MITELIGGILANSLAIMTDAAHLFSDLSAFIISIFAISIGKKPPYKIYSFGYHRAEVFGAMGSIVTIWILTAFLIKEACERIYKPEPIDTKIMLITSIFGLVVNLIMIKVLHSGGGHSHCGHNHAQANNTEENSHCHDQNQSSEKIKMNCDESLKKLNNNENCKEEKNQGSILNNSHSHYHEEENVNISAAIIHIIGDIIQSIGVVLAAILIHYNPHWAIADPICTFLFSLIVFITTLSVTKQCIYILMDGTPEKYKIDLIESYLCKKYPEIINIHDIHIWSLSNGNNCGSFHVVTFNKQLLSNIQESMTKKFHIQNCTIQIESPEENERLLNCYIKINH